MAAPTSDFSGPAGTVDGKNLVNTGGAGGVSSLNTRTGAIVLAGSASVTITEAPLNTFTFTVSGAGVTSFNTKAGAIVLASGTGISLVEAPANTFTASNTGVLSLAGGGGPARNGAIVLVGSASVTITEAPNGTYTFAAVIPAAITSLNGDTAAAQTVAGTLPITVGNAGAIHSVGINDFTSVTRGAVPDPSTHPQPSYLDPFGWQDVFQFSASAGPGIAVPDGVTTVLATHTIAVGANGSYFITFHGGVNGVTGENLNIIPRINGVVPPWGQSGRIELTGQTCTGSGAFRANLVAGNVVDIAVSHNGGGAATTSTAAIIEGFRVNAN